LAPFPAVTGPLSRAAGPFGAAARVDGVVVDRGAVVEEAGDAVCAEDEQPAKAVTAATATLTMTNLLPAIRRVSHVVAFSPVRPYGVRMEEQEMRRRVRDARVARLATVTSGGRPHLVPCCFALSGDVVYSAIDAKPKSTIAVRRLENLRANPHAALLVDHYSDDWSTLWWVRMDGEGRVLDGGDERAAAIVLLTQKYSVYAADPPPGAVVAIDVVGWRGWP
jgi:PPOX class probable F420-dependent enzyme